MSVNYREQYTPDQVEPFWPNEILRMAVVVLCLLAILMAFVVLPVALEELGYGHLVHEETPADPRSTPPHIRPEWYFLAVYQYLKLPPSEVFGISGKTIGVLSQGPFVLALLLLPFWARRWSMHRPGWPHRIIVSIIVFNFTALTFWALLDAEKTFGENLHDLWSHWRLFLFCFGGALGLLYFLLWHEVRTIRRVLYSEEPER